MLKKLFGKNSKLVEIYSPLDGEVIELDKVPDEAFASRAIGEGVAIIPNGSIIYSPMDADEISIFETKHAVSFQKNDIELIVHFGIDTVKLGGEGFTQIIAGENQKVKKGEELISYDKEFIENNAKSIITPVVVTEMDEVEGIININYGAIKAGERLFTIKLK